MWFSSKIDYKKTERNVQNWTFLNLEEQHVLCDRSDTDFKGIVVNWALASWQRRSLEITLTDPLTIIKQKIHEGKQMFCFSSWTMNHEPKNIIKNLGEYWRAKNIVIFSVSERYRLRIYLVFYSLPYPPNQYQD